ncbi:MAG: ABC transporter ATP-binding protein, partial [Megasphaera elsdenii]|nr:ABC transporter ATP-binding protein [Megasphaera elsdenii]
MEKELIHLEHVSKTYDGHKVLDGLDLAISENEFVTLLGPSGCGKTTTLRLIAGFETPDEGRILFEGADITQLPPNRRQVNTVFQNYSLFSHMDVAENIAFGPKIHGKSRDYIRDKIRYALKLVNLDGYEHANIVDLSGGQQQRVAIARAVVNEPRVLLLDEPLSALDRKLRRSMQLELIKIKEELGITFVFVTHDQEEALSMSDTIVVMSHGKIQQIGTPTDIYNEPVNAFVADFIGESNIVDGVMLEDYRVSFGGQEFRCLDSGFGKNEPVDVVIRPEDVDIIAPDKGKLRGKVTSVTFMGVHNEAIVDIDGFKWMIQTTDPVTEGAYIGITLEPDAIHIMKKSEYSGLFG